MSDFSEPDRRRRKRKGPKFQDPAALTLEERLSRLQRTLEARRTQLYEDPATKEKWLGQCSRLAIVLTTYQAHTRCAEQLQCAQAVMHGVEDPPVESQSSHSPLANPKDAVETSDNPDAADHRENDLPQVHIVCLGIGKINESRESQYQFLQLQDLASFFKVSF